MACEMPRITVECEGSPYILYAHFGNKNRYCLGDSEKANLSDYRFSSIEFAMDSGSGLNVRTAPQREPTTFGAWT